MRLAAASIVCATSLCCAAAGLAAAIAAEGEREAAVLRVLCQVATGAAIVTAGAAVAAVAVCYGQAAKIDRLENGKKGGSGTNGKAEPSCGSGGAGEGPRA